MKRVMRAIETMATVNEQGQLVLDTPLRIAPHQQVRVIVLIAEDEEIDSDDPPAEEGHEKD